jgi:hypothetical protein
MVKAAKRLFICLVNAGYEVSLERLKIYVALPDAKAERTGFLRIVDESGEDYLYTSQRFVAAELPVSTRRAVLQVAAGVFGSKAWMSELGNIDCGPRSLRQREPISANGDDDDRASRGGGTHRSCWTSTNYQCKSGDPQRTGKL